MSLPSEWLNELASLFYSYTNVFVAGTRVSRRRRRREKRLSFILFLFASSHPLCALLLAAVHMCTYVVCGDDDDDDDDVDLVKMCTDTTTRCLEIRAREKEKKHRVIEKKQM